jgi:ABC-type uncharacterized transport system involved in gliding motility auxiliary subunit
MKTGTKLATIVLLLVGLILVNYLASHTPLRLDATSQQIYTLSPGTRSILSKIEEPMTVDLYFSKSTTGQDIQYKNYAERVVEMLRQYVRASHGRITLNLIDPKPDSPQEEKATAAGIEPQTIPGGGEQFYFGLVATEADQQKSLPALDPMREQFLENDLSQLISSMELVDKKKLGLITSLPLQGNPQAAMMGQPPQEGQFVLSEWQQSFQVVPVEATAAELPADLDALAIVHPEDLSPKLQYAIDQFLLAGKPVFLAVDPSSQFFRRQGGQQSMFGGPIQNLSSDLPVLFNGWGIAYDAQKVVGDLENAEQVQMPGGAITRYPVWLGLQPGNFNPTALATAQLTSVVLIESGSFTLKPGTALTLTPLLESSAKSGDVPTSSLQFAQPDDILRQIAPTGKKTIAGLITGKFKSAFPDGAPKDAPAADADKKPAAKPAAPSLKESSGSSTLLLVADTDFLMDDNSVKKFNYMGQTAAEPTNDNLAFAANSIDFLSGSPDLISIRGKGNSIRRFTVVREMEAKAAEKYKEKLDLLENQLSEIQTKLTELQGKKDTGKFFASPEATKAIEDFQKQAAVIRGQRREIRYALVEGINSLGNRILWINLLATPLLVCLFGLWFSHARKR